MNLQPLDKRIINWDVSRFENRKCPFCGKANSDTAYIRPDKCSVLRCSYCSSYYISPSPSEELLNEFYSSYHTAHFGGNVIKTIEDIKSGLDNLDPRSDPRLDFLKKDLLSNTDVRYRVLDFGCGTGSFLYQAKKLGASVVGIEFDKSAVSICNQLGLDSVFLGGFDVLKSLDDQFNLIVLNDVIEHPLYPAHLVSVLCKLLDKNGKILIWTPNGNAIESDEQKIALRVDLEHMQYLTSGAVMELCRQNDLSVWHFQTFGFPSITNFISSVIEKSWTSKLKSKLVASLRYLGLINIVKGLLSRLGFQRSAYPSEGNYHLFCVLAKR